MRRAEDVPPRAPLPPGTGPAAFVLDLDDTLLDTAGLLVPAADARAIAAMRRSGLALDGEQAARALAALREEGQCADLFGELARRFDADIRCGEAGAAEFFAFEVPPLALEERVDRALHDLARLAPLVLLTAGNEPTQRAKVARLGIATRFEQRLYVGLHAGAKEEALRALLAAAPDRPAERVVVVGDRATSEIRAGNRLGCVTVLVRRAGAEFGAHEPTGCDVPDFTVTGVEDVAGLFGTSS